MIDDIFVYDNVIHVYDLSDENTFDDPEAQAGREASIVQSGLGRWPGYEGMKLDKRWSIDELYEMVFTKSPTDMAMTQVVPLFEWFEDFFAPVELQHAMAAKYPDRVQFCGGVDPNYRGLQDALDQCDYQIRELGAVSMKFYNGHMHHSWRCDDEKLAYPLYERIRDLGIKTIQFHKGLPLGKMPIEPLSPLDLQAPLRDFPDMNFVIHHLAVPPMTNFDHLVNIASRFENCYLSLSGFWGLSFVAPRLIHEWMGTLLQQVGAHKLLWGSEAALAGGPAPYLQAFMDLEIPADLRDNYGYPQITRDDKERILGKNFAELIGVDIPSKVHELEVAVA